MCNKAYKRYFVSSYIFLIFFLSVKAQYRTTNDFLPGIKTKDDALFAIGEFLNAVMVAREEKSSANPATKITYLNSSNSEIEDLKYHTLLCKSVNCRYSLDKWDCPTCKIFFPDMEVIRTFGTYPLDITGEIILSKEGAVSIKDKLTSELNDLMDIPFIPGGKAHQGAVMSVNEIEEIVKGTINDLLILYPKFRVHVLGHSYGGLVASYLTVKLFNDIPKLKSDNLSAYLLGKPRVGNLQYSQYVQKNKIDIKRLVHLRDNSPHIPDTSLGYVHEGVEYWEFSDEPSRTLKCEGDGESRECSNSLVYYTLLDHLVSYGVGVGCI